MINERNTLIDSRPSGAQVSQASQQCFPPLYEDHRLDQLWSDVDVNDYMTPFNALSEASSPVIRSRNASVENLGSLGALSQQHAVPAHALHSRLDNLRDASGPRLRQLTPIDHANPPGWVRAGRGIAEHANGPRVMMPIPLPGESSQMSREAITERWLQQLPEECLPLDARTLSKVPSYQTAVRAPANTPVSGDLPDYAAATRGGTSPRQPPVGTGRHPRSASAPDATNPNPTTTGENSTGSPTRNSPAKNNPAENTPAGPSTGTGTAGTGAAPGSLRNRIIRFTLD